MQALAERSASLQRSVARASLVWLLAANLVGLWLAALLLWPSLGALAGSLTYGRWMPLHMDWQLYGWCSLPLLGVIAKLYWNHNDNAVPRASRALGIWSAALVVGGLSWLLGVASGKPFLNWDGFARFFFALALAFVWAMTLQGLWESFPQRRRAPLAFYGKLAFALLLGSVPLALFIVASAKLYPPIDPTSGGATGHSLLASTLGIVAIMGILPSLGLGLPLRPLATKRPAIAFWSAFACSVILYAAIEHGNASNLAPNQIIGLGSLLIWPLMTLWHWSRHQWSPASRLWRASFLFWWALLAFTGWLTFLPDILDTLKFTNGLVAHAHLAMAGMVTALNMTILAELGADSPTRAALARHLPFYLWNISLLAFVASMMAHGFREGANPGALFRFDGYARAAYSIRLAAGLGMAFASFLWLLPFLRNRAPSVSLK